jgi:hypothetical protein
MSQSDVTSGLDIADVSCCVPFLRLESSLDAVLFGEAGGDWYPDAESK